MNLLSTSILFAQFLDQRRDLNNVTPNTIEWYETAFKAATRATPSASGLHLFRKSWR